MTSCPVEYHGKSIIQLDYERCKERTIKVLIAVNSMEKGGRTKVVAEELMALESRGHEVGLIAYATPPQWVLKRYPGSDDWQIMEKKHSKFDFILLLKLLRYVFRFKPDIIHTHCEASALYMGLVGTVLRVPTVGSVHRSKLHFYNSGWKSRMYYKFLNSYIAVSHERKSRMHKQLLLPEDRIEVIHWGIDPATIPAVVNKSEAKKNLGLSDRPMILSLGHLGTIKGHDDSIRAIALIKEKIPDVKLYIGGDGESTDYERLHSLIEELHLQDTAILLGQVTNAMEWMEACDIFLQPSLEEAFGLVFIEAGLCGKPSIATRVGGIPEIIVEGKSGYLVKPHDPDAIANRALELLGSEQLMADFGKFADQYVQENFLLSKQADRLEKHLEHLAQGA